MQTSNWLYHCSVKWVCNLVTLRKALFALGSNDVLIFHQLFIRPLIMQHISHELSVLDVTSLASRCWFSLYFFAFTNWGSSECCPLSRWCIHDNLFVCFMIRTRCMFPQFLQSFTSLILLQLWTGVFHLHLEIQER